MRYRTLMLSLPLCMFASLSLVAQQEGWGLRLSLPRSDYLPGEPITGHLVMENAGPQALPFNGFRGALYLDGQAAPCMPKPQVQADTIPLTPPPGTTGAQRPRPLEPAGTTHEEEISVTFWCALDADHQNLVGPHRVCYRIPAMGGQPVIEGCAEFTIVRPLGADAEAYKYFKGEPLKHGGEVIKKHPTSNYAALALWEQGLTWYTRALPEKGPESEICFGKTADYKECPNCDCQRDFGLCPIVRPWEKLYQDFPGSGCRAQLLYNLGRCYLLMGVPQKATPLFQELLSKFPDSEPGKKAVAYRDVLKAHGLWPE